MLAKSFTETIVLYRSTDQDLFYSFLSQPFKRHKRIETIDINLLLSFLFPWKVCMYVSPLYNPSKALNLAWLTVLLVSFLANWYLSSFHTCRYVKALQHSLLMLTFFWTFSSHHRYCLLLGSNPFDWTRTTFCLLPF